MDAKYALIQPPVLIVRMVIIYQAQIVRDVPRHYKAVYLVLAQETVTNVKVVTS